MVQHCTWRIDLLAKTPLGDWGLFYLGCHRSELSIIFFYGHCRKYLKATGLLVKYLTFFFCLFFNFAWDLWLALTTYVMNVYFCGCFQEKSTAFDFWMPIERGHQLFGPHLKSERLAVALCPFCGSVDGWLCLPCLDGSQHGVSGSCNNHAQRSSEPRIITSCPCFLVLSYNYPIWFGLLYIN